MRGIRILACIVGVLCLGVGVWADNVPVTNSGFETGDLTGWTVTNTHGGTVQVVPSGWNGITAYEGNYMLLMRGSTTGPTSVRILIPQPSQKGIWDVRTHSRTQGMQGYQYQDHPVTVRMDTGNGWPFFWGWGGDDGKWDERIGSGISVGPPGHTGPVVIEYLLDTWVDTNGYVLWDGLTVRDTLTPEPSSVFGLFLSSGMLALTCGLCVRRTRRNRGKAAI